MVELLDFRFEIGNIHLTDGIQSGQVVVITFEHFCYFVLGNFLHLLQRWEGKHLGLNAREGPF